MNAFRVPQRLCAAAAGHPSMTESSIPMPLSLCTDDGGQIFWESHNTIDGVVRERIVNPMSRYEMRQVAGPLRAIVGCPTGVLQPHSATLQRHVSRTLPMKKTEDAGSGNQLSQLNHRTAVRPQVEPNVRGKSTAG